MKLTINTKDISFSPDTLTVPGKREYYNVLIHPEEKLLLLKACSKEEKNAIDISCPSLSGKSFVDKLRGICGWSANATITCDGELCPQGILFKLKEANVNAPATIFTLSGKRHGRKTHQDRKKAFFTCWNQFQKANRAEK